MATTVWITNQRGQRVDHFDSDVDPRDADECIALLRRRAKQIDRKAAELELHAKTGIQTFRYKV